MNPPRPALDIPSLGPEPIPLTGKDRWILGSDPDRADVVLEGQDIAGVHCVLTVVGSTVEVTDMGSPVGTRMDGIAISQATWAPGQRLDVAHVGIWLASNGGHTLPAIPGYEVEREIGSGAGGRVYLAVQT
ncbi:MAG: FHA domain-containing protein, partial [Planctomycetes bacterium]|nr:FHA domain-containing protein [Planctomycetota bacterium]